MIVYKILKCRCQSSNLPADLSAFCIATRAFSRGLIGQRVLETPRFLPPSSTRCELLKLATDFFHVGSVQRYLTGSASFTYKESRSEHAYCTVFESQLY